MMSKFYKNNKSIYFFIMFLFLTSCGRNSNPVNTEQLELSTVFKEGTSWLYSIVDSTEFMGLNVTTDTVKVSVLEKIKIPNGNSAYIWQFKYKHKQNWVDTLYVSESSDTLHLYDKYFGWKIFQIIFPLQKGKDWIDNYSHYRYTVMSQDTVRTPLAVFYDVNKIRQVSLMPNTLGSNYFFIDQRYGIIKIIFSTFTTTSSLREISTWKLIGFYTI